jgi:hypothetical protein
MMYPYVLLTLASMLIVATVWFAYEMGRRVGAYEERRNRKVRAISHIAQLDKHPKGVSVSSNTNNKPTTNTRRK